MSTTEHLRRALGVLELAPGAGAEEIRSAYLDWIKIYHPDRYQTEPERLRNRVELKLREVNAAYEQVRFLVESTGEQELIPMDFGSHWGFVDPGGRTVIYPDFQEARGFHEGLAAVLSVSKWGFIDREGIFRVNPLYDSCGDFHEGLAAVEWHGRWGYVDASGSFVIQPRFQSAEDFQGGVAKVRLGARWGTVTRGGQLLFDPFRAGRHIEGESA